MKPENKYSEEDKGIAVKIVTHYNRLLYIVLGVVFVLVVNRINPKLFDFTTDAEPQDVGSLAVLDEDRIENGIHVESGLIVDDGYELVLNNCGNCHSYKLVTQNKGDEQAWKDIIKWMQETQKLWDLGPMEKDIVAYLAKNYGPENTGRRKNLENIEWYELK